MFHLRPLHIYLCYFSFVPPPLYKFLATGLVLTKINIQVYNLLIQAYFTYKSTLQDLHFLLLIFSLVSVFKRKHRPIVINIILYFNKLTDICFIFRITSRCIEWAFLSPPPPPSILRLSVS